MLNSSEQQTMDKTHNPVSDQRRRILTGSAAVPILSVLHSRKVLGMTHVCSPSGFASGNLSGYNHRTGNCGGKSPGYWKNYQKWSTWPGAYIPGVRSADPQYGGGSAIPAQYLQIPNTRMVDGFGCAPTIGDTDITMMEVLREYPGTTEYHAVAVLLNAAQFGAAYAVSVPEAIGLYCGYATGSGYTTSSGTTLIPSDIDLFLRQAYE